MKKVIKIASACLSIAVLLLVAVVAIRIIKGSFALVGSVMNTILGIVVILGTLTTVIFMFHYAKKKK